MTKIASRVNTVNDIRSMQRTLDKIVAWASRWDVDFSVDRYEVTYVPKNTYFGILRCGTTAYSYFQRLLTYLLKTANFNIRIN